MNRDKNSKSVAHFYLLFSLCLIPADQNELWAKTRFSTDLATPKYFLHLVLISISFVQGALNGLFILTLRNFKHAYAGDRWTQGFWAGFPCAFFTSYLVLFLISHVHNSQSITQLDPLIISIWLAFFLCLNACLVYRLSIWAAKEN